MKRILLLVILVCIILSFSGMKAQANEVDEIRWVAKCMMDNIDQGQSEIVVRKYCECMSLKMESSETQTVTQWEKSHPRERKDCDRQAGWK